MTCKPLVIKSRLMSSLSLMGGATVTFVAVNLYKGNESFYKDWLMPTMHRVLDAERAHQLAIQMAKYQIVPPAVPLPENDQRVLKTSCLGLTFHNPIGLAAGFDKNGDGLTGLSKMGFGFVEIGSVTPKPQDGNPQPRVFRLLNERAIINRYGFNSHGHHVVQKNLINFARKLGADDSKVRVGMNLGKNKSSPESSVDDYVMGLKTFADNEVVDYFVINISSPNTPGLRNLQQADQLQLLLNAIADVRVQANVRKPIFLKISPDLTPNEREHVCHIIMNANNKQETVDGIIVSNTTTWRPENSQDDSICEVGGLSGVPLRSLSTDAIRHVYAVTGGKLPIIGVGGVFTGKDAFEKIRAGASLIQLYTSLALDGPPVIASINRELAVLLRDHGFKSVSEAVGSGHTK